MNFEEIGQLGAAAGGIAALLASLKALIDIFRVKRERPGDSASQQEALNIRNQTLRETYHIGRSKQRVSTGRILLRIIILWVAMIAIFGAAILYDESIYRMSDVAGNIVLGVMGFLAVLSLVYVFRVIYRGVVYVFIH